MDIDEGMEILKKQEELLQFNHFNRQDAWRLGKELVAISQNEGVGLSLSIRLRDGLILFQYLPEGTNQNNESWMTRKFNAVRMFETSSLFNGLRLKKNNQTFESRGYDPRLFAPSGGGFPIRIRGTGVIGAIVTSGGPHLQDHDILIEGLIRHLKAKDVPRIPLDAGL
ncbi:UPF0303 protein [Spirochaetia bacterium]|nr:UPF0303 protein [Spirochaetia bacterium]